MRPLTLTIEGLRSFRSPVEISFEGRDHLAVIGDTGAGKSSILEAMTYALFGRTTFTGQANQEIINDLADHMRVTLRFTVAGRTFEVTRTLRRAGDRTVGAAKASLTEFGPDGTEIRKIEQVRQVNGYIQEALGLDPDAFLRTVVLPQGQFAQLLVGDDPVKRAAILRQVWRTDELTRAGQLADEALPPLSELVGQVTQALGGTPDDPARHLQQLRAEAERRIDAATHARGTLRAASRARDTLAEADTITRTAEEFLGKIRAFDFDEATATAEEIVRRAASIAAKRKTAEDQQETLHEQLRAVPSDDDGLDHQAIGAARTTLGHLPSQAEAAINAAARARTEAAEAQAAERQAAELERQLQQVTGQLDQREKARQDLDQTLIDAESNSTSAQAVLREIQQAVTGAKNVQAQARNEARQAELLQQEATQLRTRDLTGADERAKITEKAYADAQRHRSAAAAAHDLHPGDDCSVCNRPLPQDWQPPIAEDLEAARDAYQTAQHDLTGLRDKIHNLETSAQITNKHSAEFQQQAERSWDTARTTAERLTPLLGHEIDLAALPPADQLLQPLSSAAAKAREQLEAHEQESQRLRERHVAAQANLTNAHSRLTDSNAARTWSSKEAAGALRALRTGLTSLPDQLPVEVSLPDDPLAIEEIPLTGLDAAYQALNDRAQELGRRAEHRTHLRQQLDQLTTDLQDLNRQWTGQVLSPGNELVAAVNSHRDTVSGAIRLLNLREVTLPPAASLGDPAGLADMVRAFREVTDAVTDRTHALVQATQKDADAARHTIAKLAAELGIPATDPQAADPGHVVARAEHNATEADVEARRAERDADDFARLVAPLTQLRSTGEELTLAYRALKDLSAALKPGAFPKWLTLRRSRALLAHASRLLEQMSSGRYAFAELDDENAEWRVIDNDSRLARTPASFSGGEQFIASLALALGMVEMMARSGGRLESLWLDEGFGSLDRSNLDAAIEALASVAARGRMVAVISHIRAVADQVNHVLAVTREVTGTRATWLDPAQRAQLAASDLDSDTTGALAGLLD